MFASYADPIAFEIPGYTVVEQLYCGSRTAVYRAIATAQQRPVVIKVLRSEYPNFSELLQFRNQYTITRNLPIAGIVKPIGLEPVGSGYALVMEDCGGMALSYYLEEQKLNCSEILGIAIQLSDILHDLAQHHVVHKDIKPANILIDPESKQIKLIDFSIASLLPKENQDSQSPHNLEGTLAYLAPEQTGRMNRGIDYRTDFYALGVTLYELLTGVLPFTADEPLELVYCHIAKNAIPVHQVNPTLPEVMGLIVAKLMAKNAEDRYQSALGLKYDLEKCLTQWQETGTVGTFTLGDQDLSDRFMIPEKLYGREAEVESLLAAFDRVASPSENRIAQGTSELMLVAGFSGIGKTAVVNEVHKPITRQQGYFIKGKFDQFNRNIPLSAFVQALRDLMAQLLSESDAQLSQWKTQILAAVGENGQVLIDVIPELVQIIGQQPAAPELSGSAAQNRFNLLFQNFIEVFTTREHPLVIFLDDLQWADSASLQLIKLLINDNGYLLMLGAYRDNEVSPAHPFILTIDELKKSQTTVNTITLSPLDFADVNQIIADTLSCPISLVQPLTELVMQKTQGNPFFLTQFLKALHEEGLITFNQNLRYWACDITTVKARSLTDDVVEFMAQQLQKLPAETQQVLKLAACIGNQFDLNTLEIVSEQPPTIAATALWKALQEGLILPTSQVYKFFQDQSQTETSANSTYRFLHDRVQQAAYLLIPVDQKQITHLKIGRLLRQHQSQTDKEHLFDILSHLNASVQLITSLEERRSLLELNLLGCHRAKAATAYSAAAQYVHEAANLLPDEPWQTEYCLTQQIYEIAAEVAYLNTEFAQAENLIQSILRHAREPIDCIKSYELLVQIYISQDQQVKAIETGLAALQHLGVPLLECHNWQANLPKLPSLGEMSHYPQMLQPEYLAALRILIAITPPTHHVKPELFPAVVLTMVDLCDRAGHSELAAYAYGIYGLLLCAGIGDLDMAHRAGQISLTLLEQYHAREVRTKVNMLFAVFVCAGQEPGAMTLPILQQGIEVGLDVGDIEHVSYSIMAYFSHLFLLGQPLEQIAHAQNNYLPILEQFKQEHCIEYSSIWLRLTDEFTTGSLSNTTENKALEHFEETHNHQCLFAFHLAKLISCYSFNQTEIALDHAESAIANQDAAFGILLTAAHNFYHALALLATIALPESPERDTIMATVMADQEKLQQLAHHAPSNYRHKLDLVSAEIHRVQNHQPEAIDLYDRAIAGAKANGYLPEEALANELAAKFYLNWGKEKIAAGYLQEAYYCYARWGAQAKTDHLEQHYPELLRPILQQASQSLSLLETLVTVTAPNLSSPKINGAGYSANTSVNTMLDLATIIKISQNLASTIQLDDLLHQLIQTMLEQSGADRAALILVQDGCWQVKVTADLNTITLENTPLKDHSNIPIHLIQYVKNTASTIVHDRPKTDLPIIDQYLIQYQPQSVLGLPILKQGHLIGILYLENRATSGVFSHDRLLILDFLCTQAAISIDNAQMFNNLQQQKAQLQQSAAFMTAQREASLDGILVVDNHRVISAYNQRFLEIWQIPPELHQTRDDNASLSHVLDKLVDPQAFLAKVMYLYEHINESSHCELLLKDNRIIERTSTPVNSEDGENWGRIWYFRDITGRKQAEIAIQEKSQALEQALRDLENAQLQTVQSEKMASLGNLVAGVAHEVNNPIGFLNGSIKNAQEYIKDLLEYIALYEQQYPNPTAPIQTLAEDIDLEFLREDLPKLLDSMKGATDRIKGISTSLRTFSRADTEHKITANLHEGLDSTLLILKYRIKANEFRPAIEIKQNYGELPAIACFPGQLNQVFMNILANAIDMFDEVAQTQSFAELQAHPQTITIHTEQTPNQVCIRIQDNGKGMDEATRTKIFDHLFTTKGVGKGTGLGLAIARQIIVEKHDGQLEVRSELGQGTEFCICLPI
jgi:predicted ATPase/signal transduction histidine kinase